MELQKVSVLSVLRLIKLNLIFELIMKLVQTILSILPEQNNFSLKNPFPLGSTRISGIPSRYWQTTSVHYWLWRQEDHCHEAVDLGSLIYNNLHKLHPHSSRLHRGQNDSTANRKYFNRKQQNITFLLVKQSSTTSNLAGKILTDLNENLIELFLVKF